MQVYQLLGLFNVELGIALYLTDEVHMADTELICACSDWGKPVG